MWTKNVQCYINIYFSVAKNLRLNVASFFLPEPFCICAWALLEILMNTEALYYGLDSSKLGI